MKLKNIFITLASVICVLTACEKQEIAYLDNIQLDKTYLAAPPSGGTVTLKVTAKEAWTLAKDIVIGKDSNKADIYSELPTWIKASAVSGGAGETTITFTVEGAEYGREQAFRIICGSKEQYFIIRQGSLDITDATIAEASSAPDGKVFRLTGVITDWYSNAEQYGNYYITDDTGTILIYGTADKDGKLKNYPVASWGLELGDVVTVEGPRGNYQGSPQMVDVTITKLVKSLIQLDKDTFDAPAEGTELVVKAAYKGNGVFLTPDVDWISVAAMDYVKGTPTKIIPNPADTAVVTLRIAPNDGIKTRQGTIIFNSSSSSGSSDLVVTISQLAHIYDASIADFNAAEVGTLCRITGVITKVANTNYGNYYIRDWSGETYIYGTGEQGDFVAGGWKEGDIVTVVGTRDDYKGTIEMTGSVIEETISVQVCSIADFLAKPDSKTDYYMVTGKISNIANTTYGNLYLSDGINELYVYGCYPGYGATGDNRKYFLQTADIKEGDQLTMIGYRDTYNGTVELCGGIYFSHVSSN